MLLADSMKLPRRFQIVQGLSGIDLLVIIGTLSLGIVGIVLPALTRQPRRGPRIQCVSNLRQLGVAFRMWANDNQERFPWSTTNLAEKILQPYAYCLLATNELNSPKILFCPADKGRKRAVIFDASFSNQNLSYFLALDADETKPNTLLSGDRNLSTNNTILSGLITLHDSKSVSWTADMHLGAGNVGLADGSAQQINTPGIRSMINGEKIPMPQHLLIP
jgi:hypothetical protein